MDNGKWYSVDRILEHIAVLEDREGNCFDVPLAQLPEDVKAGVQLCLVDGVYQIDQQATTSKRQKIVDLQNRLKNKNS